ncbi:hypothetical protein Q3O60_07105 [Alkalimonas collagenimarina]|uniref:Uncharacterized protein n=1 Tax=Alkalimonas collagenimarina TaxID=400390 RepID=A0ABT9GY16_9GAMM|nr:hypothetical protein [Alkalimonas collagenimarina]MDP4535950.1 hypothetical protein [Alkalimonas collagenimarina]
MHFDWMVTLGEEGDSISDPSVQWPAERQQIHVGTLRITSSGDDSCVGTNFDPNVLSLGFRASDDPILQMRSPTYAISFGKRLSGQ